MKIENTNNRFDVEEFVPPNIFKKYGIFSLQFIDPRIVQLAVAYREFFNEPIRINTWHLGGDKTESGFRIPRTKTGGELSQHKFGRAFDCRIGKMSGPEMFRHVYDNFDHFKLLGLTTIESYKFTPTWLHSDVRFTGTDKIVIVEPV